MPQPSVVEVDMQPDTLSQIPRYPNPRDFKVVRFLLLRSQELLHVIGLQAVKPWLKFNELASGCKSIGKFVKPDLAHGLVKVWPSWLASSRKSQKSYIYHAYYCFYNNSWLAINLFSDLRWVAKRRVTLCTNLSK